MLYSMKQLTPSLRNVQKETWLAFKSEAAKHDVTMAEFLDMLIKEHLKKETAENMIMSEKSLQKDWDNEYDERWNKY